VHEQYIQHGGQFSETSEVTKRKKELLKRYQQHVLNKRGRSKDTEKGDKKSDEKNKK
jgi:hypothetical protein